jgi:uncharacterized membrane protein YdjX (TVP38/TMEM64 family)
MSNRAKHILGLCLFATLLLLIFYASTKINQDQLQYISTVLGPWGIVFLGICILATQILSFLSSTPVMLVAIRLYGYPKAVVLLYSVTMVSAVTNFWIARIFGRPIVRKLVGTRAMAQIDILTKANERALLTVARLFGYFFVDAIGYALGLTDVAFPKYMTYTATLTVVPTLVEYVIFRHFTFDTLPQIIIYYGYLVLTGAVFIHLFYRLYVQGRRSVSDDARVSVAEGTKK